MGDTAVTILLGLMAVLPLYFTIKLKPELTLIVFSLALTILTGYGGYISTSPQEQEIFWNFMVLAMIGVLVSILHYILANTQQFIYAISRKGL